MPNRRSVLILAPFGRDGESIAAILTARSVDSRVVCTMGELAQSIDDATGAVVVAEEAMLRDQAVLSDVLRQQPPWSDIPFVLLRAGHGSHATPAFALPPEIINVVELERPMSAASLASAVVTALRARDKQFVIRDQIERLAESQRQLAASEAELRLIADSLPVLIAFIDTDLVYRFANQAYEEWLGRPVETIVGRHVRDVLGEASWAEREQFLQTALHGRPVRIEAPWPRPNGQRRDAEIRYLPRFDGEGKVDGFHVFATDITTQKMALEATRQQAEILEGMVRERTAELRAQMRAREDSEAALRQAQKMEAVGQLTGGIAHDFNNMLTGVLAALDLMRLRIEENNARNLGRLIDVAATSAQRAAGLTHRLLAFSRRQSLDPRAVDVNALVESMRELITRTLTEQVSLVLELADGLPPALVDENQLESALLNLAINARDAMGVRGTLHIRTFPGTCKAASSAESDIPCVVLAVVDNGAGMSPAVRERIFEPFFTTKPQGQGTGLGLSMVYGFMQQSGGRVAIDSVEGQGTTVTLSLPLATEVVETTVRSPGPVIHGRGQPIVLVEDDPQVRHLVVDVLEELGYKVHSFAHPVDALGWFEHEGSADLLVTDVGLPGMNGRDLADLVREKRPGLPVLFVTGYADNAFDRRTFLDTGMTLLTKPFSMADFSQTVGVILGRAIDDVDS